MPDITVHRHGDRWSVKEQGAESPVKEFPTREAAELAARDMAGGGSVDVVEEDPTTLGEGGGSGASESADARPEQLTDIDPSEHTRTPQAGL
jgi:hypothetical protein